MKTKRDVVTDAWRLIAQGPDTLGRRDKLCAMTAVFLASGEAESDVIAALATQIAGDPKLAEIYAELATCRT